MEVSKEDLQMICMRTSDVDGTRRRLEWNNNALQRTFAQYGNNSVYLTIECLTLNGRWEILYQEQLKTWWNYRNVHINIPQGTPRFFRITFERKLNGTMYALVNYDLPRAIFGLITCQDCNKPCVDRDHLNNHGCYPLAKLCRWCNGFLRGNQRVHHGCLNAMNDVRNGNYNAAHEMRVQQFETRRPSYNGNFNGKQYDPDMFDEFTSSSIAEYLSFLNDSERSYYPNAQQELRYGIPVQFNDDGWNDNRYCVYILFIDRGGEEIQQNDIFYVGYGLANRPLDHFIGAALYEDNYGYCAYPQEMIINCCLGERNLPEKMPVGFVRVFENITQQDAVAIEKCLIVNNESIVNMQRPRQHHRNDLTQENWLWLCHQIRNIERPDWEVFANWNEFARRFPLEYGDEQEGMFRFPIKQY